jgi:hypothetical protein
MKRFLFWLSICCLVYLSGAQNVHAQRGYSGEKCFGTAINTESANDIYYASDAGVYAVVGYQMNYKIMLPSAYILIIDPNGNLLWSGTYNGPNNDRVCTAYSVSAYWDRYDGEMFLVTGTIQNADSQDIFLVKYKWDRTSLTKVWENTCLGDSSLKAAYKIALVGSWYAPHFAITGETDDNKMCLLEIYGNDGRINGTVYKMSDAAVSSSAGYGVVELDRSHYYVCGKAVMTNGNTQAFWIHLENHGGWWTRWMGPNYFGGSYEDIGYAITKGPYTGSTAIAGKYGQSKTNSDYWLLTLDSNGRKDSTNSRTWGDADLNEELHSIEQTYYKDYIVAGRADLDPDPYNYHYNVYLAGIGSSGSMQWSSYFGGSQNAGFGLNAGLSFVRATGTSQYTGVASGMNPGTIGVGDVYVVRYVP